MKVIGYELIGVNSLPILNDMVNELLDDGYEPVQTSKYVNCDARSSSSYKYYQLMIKYDNGDI